jgi:hypothetical protein
MEQHLRKRIIARLCHRNYIGYHLSFSPIYIFHHPHVYLCSFLKERRLILSQLLERVFKKKKDPSQGESWSSFASNHYPWVFSLMFMPFHLTNILVLLFPSMFFMFEWYTFNLICSLVVCMLLCFIL